jgi:hypothetical protein
MVDCSADYYNIGVEITGGKAVKAPPGTPRGSSTGLRSPLPPQRPSAPPPLQRRPSQLALLAPLPLSLLDVVECMARPTKPYYTQQCMVTIIKGICLHMLARELL